MESWLNQYRGKRVFVTGHTGFKGSWLSEWLISIGAEVFGFSLPPPTNPSLFVQLGLSHRMHHRIGDVRDLEALKLAVVDCQPDFFFHLAAQPLVRASYLQPVETYATNIMGTAHALEALRSLAKPCAAVMVTTDKCYENREWLHSYRENDALGGYDPYSSSKGAAEIVIAGYRRSFFAPEKLGTKAVPPVPIASARAGNVVGGGDWAVDRIVPDCMRALAQGKAIPVRNPRSTRPWQHVLEPLNGYLTLGAQLYAAVSNRESAGRLADLCGGFNFGPPLDSNRSVRDVVEEVLRHWPGQWEDRSDAQAPHEAGRLNLATDKAFHLLNWSPRWNFADTIAHTTQWYRVRAAAQSDAELAKITATQIAAYSGTHQ